MLVRPGLAEPAAPRQGDTGGSDAAAALADVGKKFGRLTLLGWHGAGNRVGLWAVRCSRGAYGLCKLSSLRRAAGPGSRAMCPDCARTEWMREHGGRVADRERIKEARKARRAALGLPVGGPPPGAG